jgi:hypothetical protein
VVLNINTQTAAASRSIISLLHAVRTVDSASDISGISPRPVLAPTSGPVRARPTVRAPLLLRLFWHCRDRGVAAATAAATACPPQLQKDPAARRAGSEVALRPEAADGAAVGAPAHRRGCHSHDAGRGNFASCREDLFAAGSLHFFGRFPGVRQKIGRAFSFATASSLFVFLVDEQCGMCLPNSLFLVYIYGSRGTRHRGGSETDRVKLGNLTVPVAGFLTAKVAVSLDANTEYTTQSKIHVDSS